MDKSIQFRCSLLFNGATARGYDKNQVLLQSRLGFLNATCSMFEVAWKGLFILN
jgi:hypothetical protein